MTIKRVHFHDQQTRMIKDAHETKMVLFNPGLAALR